MPKTIELAIGAALLSQLTLILLWLGWARPWLAGGLLSLAVVYWLARRGWKRPALRAADAVFLPFGVLYLVHALAPPTAPDAIGYHLGLVTEWLGSGSLARGAVGVYDALPHGLEMLFLAAASIGGLQAAVLVHFGFLLATLPLMAGVGSRLGFDARPAALLYFASPVVGAAGTSAYVDAASAFYALATFWLLLDNRLAWAGLTAGFCYAIKMPGGLVTLAAGSYLVARGAWGGVALALAMVAPWIAHAWWLTGNPLAPLFPRMFPSPVFHAAGIESWMEYMRSYGVPWRERWWEAAIGGARTQGLLGPVFLAAPAALFCLRRRGHAGLIGAAAVCGAGWLLNAGTRFLISAAVFVALALAAVLPRRLAWGIALLQAVLCWPGMLDRYAPAGAWRLPSEWPWRAALGIESQDAYLRRLKPEYAVAAMVKRRVKAGERVLDFGETPRAYAGGAQLLASWQYTAARRAVRALQLADSTQRRALFTLRGGWPLRRLRSIRFELLSAGAEPWSIQELRLRRGGEILFPSAAWELEASPNPWEAPLAFDRNNASAWRSWDPRAAGMYLGIAGGIEVDGAELVLPNDEAAPNVKVTGVDERGKSIELVARLAAGPGHPAPLNLRREAIRHVRREGFQWILASPYGREARRLDRALQEDAQDWGLARTDEANGVSLLRINPDTGNGGSR